MPAVRSTSRPRRWKRCWAGCHLSGRHDRVEQLFAVMMEEEIGLRKNYYQHPKEDARILRKELK